MGPGMHWLGAVALTAIATGCLLLAHASGTSAGMVYLLLVMLMATRTNLALSVLVACVSALLFDYYFLEPFGTFTIHGWQGWLAMGAYVISCVVAGRVADRARRQTAQAEQRRAELEKLFALSQEMMLHGDAAGLVRDIPRLVERNLGLDAVLLYVLDEDHVYSSTVRTTPAIVRTLRGVDPEQDGMVELPQGYTSMKLTFGMRTVGILAWLPSILTQEVASAVGAQVAIALTRASAIETSARLEAARAGDRLRTALIDSLTHELRTPLTSIRAAATTLQDAGDVDAETRNELAAVMVEESARLDRLIGEAIEMAQIDAEGVAVHPVAQTTRNLLEYAVEESRAQLAGRRVTVTVAEPDDAVMLDGNLMRRVLRHLLENAARYTPAGGQVELTSRRVDGQVELCVRDNGPGIDAYDLPLIFEKFYRGKATAKGGKGSGMGLAITRAILAAHGGKIMAESVPGRGATFRIVFPEIKGE